MFRSLQLIAVVALLTVGTGCGLKPPPNLNPQATAAWYSTRVLADLDLLRDTAVTANGQQPKLVSDATTKAVVKYHLAAIDTIHAAGLGWKASVSTGLKEFGDALPASEKKTLQPYIALVNAALKEIN